MLTTAKSLSLIEQKKIQWAKEREEMVGLYGLWGRPRNNLQEMGPKNEKSSFYAKNSLPPIQNKNNFDEPVREIFKAEESETSGYLSDSPKHINQVESIQDSDYFEKCEDQLNNQIDHEDIHQQYWSEIDKNTNFWNNEKMFKNYKNKNWVHHNNEAHYQQNRRVYPVRRNNWYGTPESTSSDDGSRLRWGDRGVGIGHLWDPVVNHPDSRLPQVSDPYRQTPKWVEKSLKKTDGNQADVLIIHHPDDEEYNSHTEKNFLLGQNAPIPIEVIEERERKRKKALEHQNAIKKQLEERELRRKQERENRIREERLEEERIRKEQEIERLRYEEEQMKIRQKEEVEKKKEEAMREAIQIAEKHAREEKKRKKRHLTENSSYKNISTAKEKADKMLEQTETVLYDGRHENKSSNLKVMENDVKNNVNSSNGKILKDSGSQFEEIQLVNSFQFLNVNGLPMEGGLALMLDNPPQNNNILLPPDGVQLALLMSPRNATAGNFSLSPSVSIESPGRMLTPSKYRISERSRFFFGNKATQTDFRFLSSLIKTCKTPNKGLKQNKKCDVDISEVSPRVIEKQPKHIRCFLSSKNRIKSQKSKISLEDRPKWGINRPSIQYKKQSEKDPYYQKKIKERLKRVKEVTYLEPTVKNEKVEDIEEKELDSVARLLECQTDDEEKPVELKENIFLENGFRMNSNLSSPLFVPINSNEKLKFQEAPNEIQKCDFSENKKSSHVTENSSASFLTRSQLEAVKQIASLREGLKQLQKDYSTSRSITPFSDINEEK